MTKEQLVNALNKISKEAKLSKVAKLCCNAIDNAEIICSEADLGPAHFAEIYKHRLDRPSSNIHQTGLIETIEQLSETPEKVRLTFVRFSSHGQRWTCIITDREDLVGCFEAAQ